MTAPPVPARPLQHNRTETGRLRPSTHQQTAAIAFSRSDLERPAAQDLVEAAIRVATKGSTFTAEQPRHLVARAAALWNRDADLDPRSARYAEADRLDANGDLAGRGANKRAANWVAALMRYEDFGLESGRTPRENTRNRSSLPAAERRLGEWGRYQRRFENNLCRYQKIRLDISPAFSWDPLEHDWQRSLGKCIRHVQKTGRLPYLNASDPAEFALARWLGRQLRQLQAGTLSESRTVRLSGLLRLPGISAD